MATIINNPNDGSAHHAEGTGSSAGLIIGVVVAIILIALLFMYGLPAFRGTTSTGTNINVPDKINVDVDAPSGGGTGGGTAQ